MPAEVARMKVFALNNLDLDFVVAEDVGDVRADFGQFPALVPQFGYGRAEEYFDKPWVAHIYMVFSSTLRGLK
jgi:hypothetical protein